MRRALPSLHCHACDAPSIGAHMSVCTNQLLYQSRSQSPSSVHKYLQGPIHEVNDNVVRSKEYAHLQSDRKNRQQQLHECRQKQVHYHRTRPFQATEMHEKSIQAHDQRIVTHLQSSRERGSERWPHSSNRTAISSVAPPRIKSFRNEHTCGGLDALIRNMVTPTYRCQCCKEDGFLDRKVLNPGSATKGGDDHVHLDDEGA